nr:PREDICTED: uncharacterized protein LOC109039406 isoform X1 [Bemisia tabaci]XP_018910427.1 PREDICTED: uncharacterized protein LOC109039406 isoform X1 [Bemisia tabaci]
MHPFCLTLSGQIWHLYRPFISTVQSVSYYCAKPVQLHQISFKVMALFSTKRSKNDWDSESYSDSQKAQPPCKRQKRIDKPPKKRKTHFLCFPLVTDTSVPQLAASLKYFRQIATKPSISTSLSLDENHSQSEKIFTSQKADDVANIVDVETNSLNSDTTFSQPHLGPNPDLQILPSLAFRPAGTFHLTLGVMDLSSKESMSQALELLQSLDYANILKGVLLQQEKVQPEHVTDKDGNTDSQPEQCLCPDDINKGQLRLQQPTSSSKVAVEENHPTPFSKNNPLRITLTGLSTFPSPKKSCVFYAKPTSSPSSSFPLLKFSQAICKEFRNAGFITETRPLVLHATIANMRYAIQAKGGRKSEGKRGKDKWADGQCDARELIKCFNHYGGDVGEYKKKASQDKDQTNEFLWAEDIELNKVAICKMGAQKSEDEVLGLVYPPVGEKFIFS